MGICTGFSVGFSFFARLLLLCCLLPLAVIALIIILIIAAVRRRPALAEPLAVTDEPSQKLRQLKVMLDEGPITEEEYEAKRAEILANM